MTRQLPGPALALAAALLFGLSAPAAKILVGSVDPWLLAGLLYLGSGVGLGAARLVRQLAGAHPRETQLARHDLPWLAAAIATGGLAGPVLLMFGLASGSATQSSLLLNLEGVFTALLAWSVFGEHVRARIAIGMAAIAAGAAVLAWTPGSTVGFDRSAALVAAACLAWALDNNLTRRVAGGDPVQIAAIKGGAAGAVNVALALSQGASWPGLPAILGAGLVGLLSYGVSLVLFVRALRILGTARTGAYFATAPFVGAIAGVGVLHESAGMALLAAAGLMALGVWLHLTEQHDHEHLHEPLDHDHLHWHAEHHRHEHPAETVVDEPHSHPHRHAPLRHSHPHYPDLHHRHSH